MDGKKRTLIFSGAGNTGRSYHADLACANTRRRRHYLLEAGWQANQAIQGLGRTHRTRQKSAPLFSPVTTNVKGERRFTSTIARRIHSLGAITRGQKDSQSGMGDDNAELFREADNFESEYAKAALRAFYRDLYAGRIEDWSADSFEEETGLSITDGEGQLLTDLPPMHTFLNRLLALEIDEQNHLFAHLEQLVDANIEGAIQAGTYNRGVERITAAGLELVATETAEAPGGASVHLVEILRRDRLRPTTVGAALEIYAAANANAGTGAILLRNTRSGNVALAAGAPSQTLEDGTIQKRRRIIQPASRRTEPLESLKTGWKPIEMDEWRNAWAEQCAALPEFRESRFWLVTGVLLPIWQKLPGTDVRVYRLTTDCGTSLIGRVLTAGQMDAVRMKLGLGTSAAGKLTPGERMEELISRRCKYLLDGDLVLAGRRHMGTVRAEIEHRSPEIVPRLKALGCLTEIVQYRARVFVPDAATLGRVIGAYPVLARNETQ